MFGNINYPHNFPGIACYILINTESYGGKLNTTMKKDILNTLVIVSVEILYSYNI